MSTADDDIEIVSVKENPLFELKSQLSLFNELEKYSNQIPATRKAFINFVKSKVTVKYNEKVINLVWDKIQAKNVTSQPIMNDDPIVLSGDEDSTDSLPITLKVQEVEVPEVKISIKNMEHLVEPKVKKRKRKSEPTPKSSKGRKSNALTVQEAEKLRMDLFLDKVLEIALPSLDQRKKKKKSKLNSTV